MSRFPTGTTEIDLTNLFRHVLGCGDQSMLAPAALADRFGVSQAVMIRRIKFLEDEGLLDPDTRRDTGRVGTYHWDAISDVLGVLKEALAQRTPPTKTDPPTKKESNMNVKPNGSCYCNCGTKTGPKAVFAPGHDARLVSGTVNTFVETVVNTGWKAETPAAKRVKEGHRLIEEILKDHPLPSDVLTAKTRKAMQRALAKHLTADVTTPTRKVTHDWEPAPDIKSGRWTYPCRVSKDGSIRQRNTKRDGTGEWINV